MTRILINYCSLLIISLCAAITFSCYAQDKASADTTNPGINKPAPLQLAFNLSPTGNLNGWKITNRDRAITGYNASGGRLTFYVDFSQAPPPSPGNPPKAQVTLTQSKSDGNGVCTLFLYQINDPSKNYPIYGAQWSTSSGPAYCEIDGDQYSFYMLFNNNIKLVLPN